MKKRPKKSGEELLRESKEKYYLLFKQAADSILLVDADTAELIEFNDKACQNLGYSRKKLLSMKIYEIDANFSRQTWDQCWERMKKTRIDALESYFITEDGKQFPVEIRGKYMKYDGQEHLCAIVRDTTERQRIEGTLRRAEEEKAGILDSLSEMVTYCSQDLRILWANKSAGTSAGLNPAELVGSRCYEVWHNFKRPCSDCPVLNAFKTGDYMEKEVAVSGDKIWLVKAHPVKDSEGSVSGVVEVVSDITGRKKIEQERRQNYDKSRRILEETVIALAATAERRDPYTAGHQRRVAQLACAIAREMGLGEELIEGVRMASIIHDVGKIYVPAEMLSKPSGLNDLEFSIIKTHPQIGYEILKPVEFPWPVARIVLQHHEKINGSGYPEGISGEDILIESRILTVADVVEAMASYRPYRAALDIEEALTEITKNKGSLYDCRVVDTCLKLFRKKLFKFEQKSTLP